MTEKVVFVDASLFVPEQHNHEVARAARDYLFNVHTENQVCLVFLGEEGMDPAMLRQLSEDLGRPIGVLILHTPTDPDRVSARRRAISVKPDNCRLVVFNATTCSFTAAFSNAGISNIRSLSDVA